MNLYKLTSLKLFLTDWFHAWHRMFCLPGGALSIIILLALGIGATAAVFNPIYSLVYSPLPFPQPDRLVRIGGDIPLFNLLNSTFEKRELLDRIFSNLAAYSAGLETSTGMDIIKIPDTGKSIRLRQLTVTDEFFETLGVLPAKGYTFGQVENRSGIVISHRFWQKELMGVDNVIGKSLLLGGTQPVSIIGVMPETFNFPIGTDTDVWVCAVRFNSSLVWSNTQLIGRLRSGITLGQAAKDLKAMEFKSSDNGPWGKGGTVLQSLQVVFYGDKLPLLRMVGTATILFLLLICANVANLLVAQGIRRKSEMITRMLLGATRCKLVCQLLRETLLLVLIGGVAGWGIVEFAGKWLQTQFPTLKSGSLLTPEKIVFFTVLVIVVTLVSGLSPALQATGGDLNTHLKSAYGGSRRRFFSSREILVGVQLSLTLALLIGTGVLLRSLLYRIDFPIGWSPQEIVVVSTQFPVNQTSFSEEGYIRHARFYQEALHQLETMPDVVSAGSLTPIPFSTIAIQRHSKEWMTTVYKDLPIKDYNERRNQPQISCLEGFVSSNGFGVLGIPFMTGRSFTSGETARLLEAVIQNKTALESGNAIIVNGAFAQHFWPGENAVGKIVYDDDYHDPRPLEIVGVVPDFHLINKPVAPAIYRPESGFGSNQSFLVKLRPNASLMSFQSNVRRQFSDLDAGLALLEIQRLQEHVSEAMTEQRLLSLLISCFGALGFVVSGISVYSTSKLMISSRIKEIGIRIAMGAQFSNIVRLVLFRSARALVIGLPCGLFLGWVLVRGLSSTLYQVKSSDPVIWIISCAVLLAITIVASLIPAIRAARVNPLDAMRN